jgi:hypothetical protein
MQWAIDLYSISALVSPQCSDHFRNCIVKIAFSGICHISKRLRDFSKNFAFYKKYSLKRWSLQLENRIETAIINNERNSTEMCIPLKKSVKVELF